MNLTNCKTRRWLLAAAMMVGAGVTQAQDFPSKPIRFVVPFATGGLIDAIARIMADETRKSLNTTIVVENKPGAAGLIGAQMVAQLPPDGYTVLFTSPATNTILPHLKAQMPFDPNVELMPLNALVSIDFVLAAHT
ncbi:MAG: tripartite tricarboxylate transporter substrate-binding protein, partial [Betaproteobacteria bacterium]